MLISILTGTWYAFACVSLGLFIAHFLSKRNRLANTSALIFLSTAFILGSGILSALWLLIGLAGFFKLTMLIPILCLSTLAGIPFIKSIILNAILQTKTIWKEMRSDSWGWQWIAGLSVILLIAGMVSMTYWAGDAIAFYMAVPKVLASTNSLTLLPGYEGFMSVGLLGEMHIGAFIKLNSGNDPIGYKLFSGLTSLATLCMLLGISTKTGIKRRGKCLIAAGYLTSSAVYFMLGNGKPDIIATSLGIAAYYYAFTRGPLSLIGLFTGLAGVMKLSYLVTLFPGIAFLTIWQQLKSLNFRQLVRSDLHQRMQTLVIDGSQITGWCFLAFIPHLIKNGILLNAPFAPIGQSGIGWLDQIFFSLETTRWIVFTYPIALTFGNYWGQAGNLSPMLIAFLPLAFFLPRPRKWLESPLVAITLAAIVGMTLWLIRFPSVLAPRYYLSTLLIFFPIAIRGAEYVCSKEANPRLMTFFIMFCSIVTLAAAGLNSIDFYRPKLIFEELFSTKTRCENEGFLDLCDVQKKINTIAQPGERVYLASYYRYWLRPDLLQCTNGGSDNIIGNNSSPEAWSEIYKRGFHYLIVDGTQPQFDLENVQIPSWVKTTELIRKGQAAAYKLDFTPSVSISKETIACQPIGNSKMWHLVSVGK